MTSDFDRTSDLGRTSDLDRAIRTGQRRLRAIAIVGVGVRCLLPAVCLMAVAALAQRMGWVPVSWWLVGIVLAAGWAAATLYMAAPWRITRASAALALDEGLDLDDRLSTACSMGDDASPMARVERQQTRVNLRGTLTGRRIRAALPIRIGSGLAPACLVFIAALLLAGPPAATAQAKHMQAMAEAQLETIAQVTEPLAGDDPLLAEALEELKAPLSDFDDPEQVELERLRRLTTLQEALDSAAQTDSAMAPIRALEALRSLPQRADADADIKALRDALRRGEFDSAQSALDELERSTSSSPPTGDRQAQLRALAEDLQEAAQRARDRDAESTDGGGAQSEESKGAAEAAEAIEHMAEDVDACSGGTCSGNSQAAQGLAQSQEQGSAREAIAQATAQAAAEGGASPSDGAGAVPSGGPVPMGGGGQMGVVNDDASGADAVASHPRTEGDADAEVIEVELVDGQGAPTGVPIAGPVSVGGAQGVERTGPAPESLRRLPARYQEALRRFFTTQPEEGE
ncbi:MAG: hypothetical protein MK101_02970 [Phycisphaerales bacterium]|nr:hypothetical protein [Phycisphaerales bacterium]